MLLRLGLLFTFLISQAAMAFNHSHQEWDLLLQKYVVTKGKQTLFNYKALKASADDSKKLQAYLSTLSAVDEAGYQAFSPDQKLSFLINAYNAFTVKLIIDNYPTKSIRDLGGLFSSPWKKKFFKFRGKKESLDGIEHGQIREEFKEARIHFAVNCASIGCPSLYAKAFTAKTLEKYLDAATKNFLSNTEKNKINTSDKDLELSKIFDWYEGDFEKYHGSVAKFVAPYITNDLAIQNEIKAGKYEIDHLDYDWSLNEAK